MKDALLVFVTKSKLNMDYTDLSLQIVELVEKIKRQHIYI